MTYEFSVLTQKQAEHIAYNWHYDGEYIFYDMESDKEDLEEFLSSKQRGNSTFAVTENNDLVAFLSVYKINNNTYEIGLGMRPDLTGKGKGEAFLRSCLTFIQSQYHVNKITLSVASFNQRAIKVYRQVGFKDVEYFMQDTNGSTFEFLKMEYHYKV